MPSQKMGERALMEKPVTSWKGSWPLKTIDGRGDIQVPKPVGVQKIRGQVGRDICALSSLGRLHFQTL